MESGADWSGRHVWRAGFQVDGIEVCLLASVDTNPEKYRNKVLDKGGGQSWP